jgi:Ca2+-binding RTX toxin-like protein
VGTLVGSIGIDMLYGGAGDDLVFVGTPTPGDIDYDNEGSVYLDEGNDFLGASDATLRFDAYGGEGNDCMMAGVGNDTVYGGTGADRLTGGDGADQLFGGDDRDLFFGGIGDVIDGVEGGR